MLELAVEALDGSERAGLAELASILRQTLDGGLDMVDEVRLVLAEPA